ncbi:hypothetical protein PWT90_02442 [Aphanocladium album]|nr:hypothetical protein PWT90_02442 [Aphanocladium album]
MTQWAPAPYCNMEISLAEALMSGIGSIDDATRMIPISKELLAMKARVWEGTDADISLAALWHEYVEEHYDAISSVAHAWVIDHIERIRAPIMDILSQDRSIGAFDLVEDYGAPLSYRYREEPIEFSASTEKRQADYYFRVRFLSHMDGCKLEDLLDSSIASNARGGILAQTGARQELRGDRKAAAVPRWVAQARRHIKFDMPLRWGYIGYRTCYDHSDESGNGSRPTFRPTSRTEAAN